MPGMRPVTAPIPGRSPVERPPSKAPGGRSAPPDTVPTTEVTALAELLAEVVVLAEQRAVYPGRWQHVAELALEHASVRSALAGDGRGVVTAPASTDMDLCPYCGTTADVRPITSNSPKVWAWSCAACGTDWAVSVVNRHLYLDHLTAAVLLRQLIVLADQAPSLQDDQLRARLAALAATVAR